MGRSTARFELYGFGFGLLCIRQQCGPQTIIKIISCLLPPLKIDFIAELLPIMWKKIVVHSRRSSAGCKIARAVRMYCGIFSIQMIYIFNSKRKHNGGKTVIVCEQINGGGLSLIAVNEKKTISVRAKVAQPISLQHEALFKTSCT